MRASIGQTQSNSPKDHTLIRHFVTASALAGFLAGVAEAAVLHVEPKIPGILKPDDGGVVWFLTPLVAALFFALDTVRADHLSAYSYARPTTPNLERLARQGVLFENAVAPASWTVPSFASIFTALLPHQHGADGSTLLPGGSPTLAEVLKARGYETAGFNANYAWGTAGWGIARGFEYYWEDRSSLLHNLAATVPARLLIQPLYRLLYGASRFERRDARHVNREVMAWFEHRSARPFFLFINYFDAHGPYLSPKPYDGRFGRIPYLLVLRGYFRGFMRDPDIATQDELPAVIAGYDNCLSFLDGQIGQWMEFLKKSPEWPSTIVAITADHGEAFGEHGRYAHGGQLHREVLRVPLILLGDRIPSDRRVRATVSTADLFPTILELASSEPQASPRSLRRFWVDHAVAEDADLSAVSELAAGGPAISLMTLNWHYLRNAGGRAELYDLSRDPLEKTNLAAAPQYQDVSRRLDRRLEELIATSPKPWYGPQYLIGRADTPSRDTRELINSLPYH